MFGQKRVTGSADGGFAEIFKYSAIKSVHDNKTRVFKLPGYNVREETTVLTLVV